MPLFYFKNALNKFSFYPCHIIFFTITLPFYNQICSNIIDIQNFTETSEPNLLSKEIIKYSHALNSKNYINFNKRFVRMIETKKSIFSNNTNRLNEDYINNLKTLFLQLKTLQSCNQTIVSPLISHFLSKATKILQNNLSLYLQLFRLSEIFPIKINDYMLDSILTTNPVVYPFNVTTPAYALQLICEPTLKWTPIMVYPTQKQNSYLQFKISENLKLDACSFSSCNTKCSYTVHNHLKIFAKFCCNNDNSSSNVAKVNDQFCIDELQKTKAFFYLISFICSFGSICMVGVIVKERIRLKQEACDWALMEPFFVGAAILYLIPILDWFNIEQNSCAIAVWLRILGFTIFYGSILIKIFRNLQEYRVRKAHHVIVKEKDLLRYLAIAFLIFLLALFVWTISSSENIELWKSSWPQCPMDATAIMWAAYELIGLLYGMKLCYKARSSNWTERYQFTLAICLEAIVTLTINIIRYFLRNTASNDVLFILAIIQLHFTVSLNITAIILPKFLANSENSRKTLIMSGIGGSSARAHPSLAKLRDNIVNGTIDFADIPITDMNAEDIRAELKRVYTQLRMYKLKNIYQDNPHISKRKGGGKKIIDKTTLKNRQINISSPPSNFPLKSPKVRQVDDIPLILHDEKNDLTIESSPHNVFLSTTNKKLFFDSKTSNNQSNSVRV